MRVTKIVWINRSSQYDKTTIQLVRERKGWIIENLKIARLEKSQ